MKYNILINQIKAMEFGLNFTQASIMGLMGELSNWADAYKIGDEVYYKLTSGKIINELPMVSDSKSTINKIVKTLKDKELLEYISYGNESYYRVSQKGATYFREGAEIRSWGEPKSADNNNTSNNNSNILSKDNIITKKTKVSNVELSNNINLLISGFKTILSSSGFVYSNDKERIYATHLIRNKDFLNAFGSPLYGMKEIMGFASKDPFRNGKITSIKSLYYSWSKLYNSMKVKGLVVSLKEKQEREEARKKAIGYVF